MEDIRKIKIILNRLNKACSEEKKSISSMLEKWQVGELDFLKMIGINEELLDDNIIALINSLLSELDTKIYFSKDMHDNEHDEIEIYSSSRKTSISFLKNEIKVLESMTKEDELFVNSFSLFIGCRKKDEDVEKIEFALQKVTDKSDRKTSVISQKYPVKHMTLGATYENGTFDDSFEITINDDMILSDLNYIEQLLYQYRYGQAKDILLRYPATIKIISDTYSMHNFNNR